MSAIIFDFDGTIADSRDYIINFMVKNAQKPPLNQAELVELHGLSMIALARRLGYSWLSLPSLYFKGRRRMDRAIHNLDTFQGMVEVIRKLHAEGHQLFIVSSNSVRNIRAFLRRHRLRKYFMEVYGGIEVFGKAPVYRQLIRDNNLEPSDVITIGDELRDVEAAQSVGLKTIAVTWGFARSTDLLALNPNGVANHPRDIIHILEQI